jgi:hypothetical protein
MSLANRFLASPMLTFIASLIVAIRDGNLQTRLREEVNPSSGRRVTIR